MQAESLYAASTGLCADSVEAVPGAPGLFVLATYQVDKEETLAPSSNWQDSCEDETRVERDANDGREETRDAGSSPAYSRRGTCTLYQVGQAKTLATESKVGLSCESLQALHTPAILDMKWSVYSSPSSGCALPIRKILGLATARGEIQLQQLAEPQARLQHLRTLTMNNSGGKTMCLSLDWGDRRGGLLHGYHLQTQSAATKKHDTSLVVSQSDGSLCYLPSLEVALANTCSANPGSLKDSLVLQGNTEKDDDDDWEQASQDEREEALIEAHDALNKPYTARPRGLETWKAHDYEAWIVGFDCWSSSSVAWSGGDDLSLRGWDLRTPNNASGRKSIFTTSKCFDGGVTTLQSSHMRQHLWAVGSYDSKLRLMDARSPQRPLAETDMGGGVWRVKWHPTDPAKMLVGCMHDGFKIVSLDQLSGSDIGPAALRGSSFEIVKRFDLHSSLAYGCDWDRHTDVETKDRLVYSCSFYDTVFHVWQS